MDIQRALGNRIRKFREEKKLTQDELAFLCGTNQAHIGRIERGENNTTLEILVRISQGLKVPLSKLFDFDSDFIVPYDGYTLKAIRYMEALTEESRAHVVEIIKTFLK